MAKRCGCQALLRDDNQCPYGCDPALRRHREKQEHVEYVIKQRSAAPHERGLFLGRQDFKKAMESGGFAVVSLRNRR